MIQKALRHLQIIWLIHVWLTAWFLCNGDWWFLTEAVTVVVLLYRPTSYLADVRNSQLGISLSSDSKSTTWG